MPDPDDDSQARPVRLEEDWAVAERGLQLTDQVIGLRARLAEEVVRHEVTVFKLRESYEESLELLHQARTADAALRLALSAATTEIEQLRSDLHSCRTADAGLRVVATRAEEARRLAEEELRHTLESADWKVGHRIGRVARSVRSAARRRPS